MAEKAMWVIQARSNDRDVTVQNLIYAVEELSREIIIYHHVPFDDDRELTFLPCDRPVIFHGAIGCVDCVQRRKLPAKPFAWFDFEKLSCHSYYAFWGEYLAAKHYGFYPLAEIERQWDWLFETFGREDHIFIRPDSNDKLFTGEVVSKDQLASFMNWAYIQNEMKTPLCVVATPTTFEAEWRLFVADGKVVAGSRYKEAKCLSVSPDYPQEAVLFAEKVAAMWSPHPFYVLDIGLTPFGYKVVECGSANCAGFYAADVRPIVEAMTRIAEREWNDA